jgi:hypothetical protein
METGLEDYRSQLDLWIESLYDSCSGGEDSPSVKANQGTGEEGHE